MGHLAAGDDSTAAWLHSAQNHHLYPGLSGGSTSCCSGAVSNSKLLTLWSIWPLRFGCLVCFFVSEFIVGAICCFTSSRTLSSVLRDVLVTRHSNFFLFQFTNLSILLKKLFDSCGSCCIMCWITVSKKPDLRKKASLHFFNWIEHIVPRQHLSFRQMNEIHFVDPFVWDVAVSFRTKLWDVTVGLYFCFNKVWCAHYCTPSTDFLIEKCCVHLSVVFPSKLIRAVVDQYPALLQSHLTQPLIPSTEL